MNPSGNLRGVGGSEVGAERSLKRLQGVVAVHGLGERRAGLMQHFFVQLHHLHPLLAPPPLLLLEALGVVFDRLLEVLLLSLLLSQATADEGDVPSRSLVLVLSHLLLHSLPARDLQAPQLVPARPLEALLLLGLLLLLLHLQQEVLHVLLVQRAFDLTTQDSLPGFHQPLRSDVLHLLQPLPSLALARSSAAFTGLIGRGKEGREGLNGKGSRRPPGMREGRKTSARLDRPDVALGVCHVPYVALSQLLVPAVVLQLLQDLSLLRLTLPARVLLHCSLNHLKDDVLHHLPAGKVHDSASHGGTFPFVLQHVDFVDI
mmetsp:Transcript_30185/g.97135  ORF Transcript_30185/g.97135 Transcript_30185/m.97135 type:complete len:317 (-) Transcript_30185:635-1585(-)